MNENLIESVRAVANRMPIIKTCKPMPIVLRYVDFEGMQDYRLKRGVTCT